MSKILVLSLVFCLALDLTSSVPCSSGQPEVLSGVRKPLGDPNPQVRLQAALALAERQGEEAVGVLIDLLADLTHDERRLAEEALQQLAGEWAPNTARIGDDEIARRIRRDAWAAWWRHTDGPALLAAFRKQTLNAEESDNVKKLIAELGDSVCATRERATADLVALGNKVVPLLRQATPIADLEQERRIESCLKQIAERQDKEKLPPAAARLLVLRKQAGATETLLAYLGFTDEPVMRGEIGKAVKGLAAVNGMPDPILIKTLEDPLPLRRALAAEVLAGVGDAGHRIAVRKLLADSDPAVRLRVAVALIQAGDREAVPALIDLVADLPSEYGWQAEELLHRLAGAKAPQPGPGDDASARKEYSENWKTWWQENGAKLDLTAATKDSPYFQIIRMHSGKALAVEEDSPKNGAGLIQRTATGSEAQQWLLLKRAEHYLIVNRKSGKVLDVPNGSNRPDGLVQIHLWGRDGAQKQQWSIEKWENYSVIRSRWSGLVLDVAYGNTNDGAPIIQYEHVQGSPDQLWKLIPVK